MSGRPRHTALASVLATAVAASLVGVSACTGPSGETESTGKPAVMAAFYPLEYLATRIAGDDLVVIPLTKPGAEPHDVELTPRTIADLPKALLVVYAKGFQPAVDDALAAQPATAPFDVTQAARLTTSSSGTTDPHFWLDPVRYADVATALAARLASVDPAHAAGYTSRAGVLVAELTALNGQWLTGTRTCQIKDLVTSHAAFGYLAAAYGFTQVPIAGVSPDAEPSAADLAQVADLVRSAGVTTIYTEPLVDPKLAATLASSTGATVATLDPVEGITSTSAGTDYLAVMTANLAAVRAGQRCP